MRGELEITDAKEVSSTSFHLSTHHERSFIHLFIYEKFHIKLLNVSKRMRNYLSSSKSNVKFRAAQIREKGNMTRLREADKKQEREQKLMILSCCVNRS